MAEDLKKICGIPGEGLSLDSAHFLETLRRVPPPTSIYAFNIFIFVEVLQQIRGRGTENRAKDSAENPLTFPGSWRRFRSL